MTNEKVAALIAVDWGTSSFRARTVTSCAQVIDTIATSEGILAAKDHFEQVLKTNIAKLEGYRSDLPIILSGMIGSRNGWLEVPYATMPTQPSALSQDMVSMSVEGLGEVWFIPGIMAQGENADVMRGEETEIFGAIEMLELTDAAMVIPGTHSKHVSIQDGAITSYKTYLTGDMFHALTSASILGAFGKTADQCDWFEEGVRIGAREGKAGALLNRVFTARSRVLVDKLPEEKAASYLSGILIGAEIAELLPSQEPLWVLGNGALPDMYKCAFELLGGVARVVPPGGVVHGAVKLAQSRHLI